MNDSRVLHIPTRKLAIAASLLFLAGGFALSIIVARPLLQFPFGQAPSEADSQEIVDDFHTAVNSHNADQVLALFANGATITENKTAITGKRQIQNWVLYSKQMTGLHLKLVYSEIHAEKFIWLDEAHNGLEGQEQNYILRWEAVIAEGKIQSLVVIPKYMPDLK